MVAEVVHSQLIPTVVSDERLAAIASACSGSERRRNADPELWRRGLMHAKGDTTGYTLLRQKEAAVMASIGHCQCGGGREELRRNQGEVLREEGVHMPNGGACSQPFAGSASAQSSSRSTIGR